MVPSAGRLERPSPLVLACYVSYAAVGWYLSGLGAILPELEDEVGGLAASYPIFPGVVLLLWGLIVVTRDGHTSTSWSGASAMGPATIALASALATMGLTAIRAASLAGALTAAAAAAALIRTLPAALATARPADTERVMIRANAWSSLATISAPLTIGATIAGGSGWMPGLVVPIGAAAVSVCLLLGRRRSDLGVHRDHLARRVVKLAEWWREWVILALSIVVEFCFAYFAATYLHETVGLSTASAAAGGAAWGIGMATGRFVLSRRESSPRQTQVSLATIGSGFALVWVVPHPALSILGIGIAGLGAAALYPVRMTALLARFPSSPAQASARGSVASGAALLAAPAMMSALRAVTDVRTAFLVVPVLLVAVAVLAARGTNTTSYPAEATAAP